MKLQKLLVTILLIFSTSANAHKSFLRETNTPNQLKKMKTGSSYYVELTEKDEKHDHIRLELVIVNRSGNEAADVEWKVPDSWNIIQDERQTQANFSTHSKVTQSIVIDTKSMKYSDQAFIYVTRTINGEKNGATVSYIYKPESDFNGLQKMSPKKEVPKKIFY